LRIADEGLKVNLWVNFQLISNLENSFISIRPTRTIENIAVRGAGQLLAPKR
jgi:hypothetical protein